MSELVKKKVKYEVRRTRIGTYEIRLYVDDRPVLAQDFVPFVEGWKRMTKTKAVAVVKKLAEELAKSIGGIVEVK